MKKYMISLLLYCVGVSMCTLGASHAFQDELRNVSLEDLATIGNHLSDQDYSILIKNADIDCVYIPDSLKDAIKVLMHRYTDFETHIDISPLLLNDTIHIAAEEDILVCMQKVVDILDVAEIEKTDPALKIIGEYMRDLASGEAFIFSEQQDEHEENVRKKKCKTYCNLLVRNCLRAGAVTVSGNAVIDGTLTVDGTVINNNSSAAFKFPDGTNGQLLIGSTGGIAQFASATSSDGSIILIPGPGTLELEAVPVFGNVARVDQIFGNDSTGKVSGAPFLTIGAALNAAAAYASGPVVVWVFPGIYNEAIIIPDNVSVVGVSMGGSVNVGGITIQQTSGATTLVTMGQNTALENITLQLTGNSTSTFTGIDIPTGPATINRTRLEVNNTTGTAYGILASGDTAVNVDASNITTISGGTSRGVYVNGAANVIMSKSTITTSGYNAIGVETVNEYGLFTANASIISGTTADISESAGDIILAGTTLANSTANYLGFTTTISPAIISFATLSNTLTGGVPNSGAVFPGTAAVVIYNGSHHDRNIGYTPPQKLTVKNMYVATTAPVVSNLFNVNLYYNNFGRLASPTFDTYTTAVNVTDASGMSTSSDLIIVQIDWDLESTQITDLMISAVLY